MIVSAIDAATAKGAIFSRVKSMYGWMTHDDREDIAAGAALDLVSRHRRNPDGMHPLWKLIDFSVLAAAFAMRSANTLHGESSFNPIYLAAPPNKTQETYAQRESEEDQEDELEAFKRLTAHDGPNQIRERERLTRIALGTSPAANSSIAPKRIKRKRIKRLDRASSAGKGKGDD